MQSYIIFFISSEIAGAYPIAIFFNKNKAIKHIHSHGNDRTVLRTSSWKEGVLPSYSDCTTFELPPKPEKKDTKKEPVTT
jgi:hypothetical protein